MDYEWYLVSGDCQMNWGKSGFLREASSEQVSETNATVYALLCHSWQPAGEDHDLVCNMIYLP